MNSARRLIKNGGIAKRLMARGHLCVDAAPRRDDPSKSVFIFYADQWLGADVDEIMRGPGTMDRPALEKRLASLGVSEAEYRRQIFESYLESGGAVGKTANRT